MMGAGLSERNRSQTCAGSPLPLRVALRQESVANLALVKLATSHIVIAD
jgi:hypothetical protein